jgi:hypothetical protein
MAIATDRVENESLLVSGIQDVVIQDALKQRRKAQLTLDQAPEFKTIRRKKPLTLGLRWPVEP